MGFLSCTAFGFDEQLELVQQNEHLNKLDITQELLTQFGFCKNDLISVQPGQLNSTLNLNV